MLDKNSKYCLAMTRFPVSMSMTLKCLDNDIHAELTHAVYFNFPNVFAERYSSALAPTNVPATIFIFYHQISQNRSIFKTKKTLTSYGKLRSITYSNQGYISYVKKIKHDTWRNFIGDSGDTGSGAAPDPNRRREILNVSFGYVG